LLQAIRIARFLLLSNTYDGSGAIQVKFLPVRVVCQNALSQALRSGRIHARSTGAPRIAAIEYPFGMTLGQPGDTAGQLAVLRATLQAMKTMTEPGAVVHLPFEWTSTEKLALGPKVAPPIAQYLLRHPWALSWFLNRTPPVK
jgi:D-proline reductase (dithiol) PrdB